MENSYMQNFHFSAFLNISNPSTWSSTTLIFNLDNTHVQVDDALQYGPKS